ncbi:ATP-binding protein [Actinosynnema sp. NPDC023587]|uniref:sensor histidine kinase n=1 Tax=Actinosynnema sp. NPDC023587 TaxID=3154695 RepID=UPI003411736C
MRTAVVVCAGGAALVQCAPGQRPWVASVVVGLWVWSAWYVRWGGARLLVADTAVVVALCVAQRWIVPVEALSDSTNWVLAIVSCTAVAHQWLTSTRRGALLTAVLVVALLAGDVLAAPQGWGTAVSTGLWTVVEAALSRLLFLLVRNGSRRADRAVAAGARARTDAAVAAARRDDEREHLALLHDTAASTLLAVGSRMVERVEPWLADQAARDLAALAAPPGFPEGREDLARLLGEVARHAPVAVSLRSPDTVPVGAVRGAAVSAAVREALTNVARHAGVGTAEVLVRRAGGLVVVEVVDRGRGFAPGSVPAHRRGLSCSVRQRLARIGGRAVVTSRPGAGTSIRLEWPDG